VERERESEYNSNTYRERDQQAYRYYCSYFAALKSTHKWICVVVEVCSKETLYMKALIEMKCKGENVTFGGEEFPFVRFS